MSDLRDEMTSDVRISFPDSFHNDDRWLILNIDNPNGFVSRINNVMNKQNGNPARPEGFRIGRQSILLSLIAMMDHFVSSDGWTIWV